MAESTPQIPAPDAVKTILEHASRCNQPVHPPGLLRGKPVIVVPHGYKIEELPWNETRPDRVRASVMFHQLASFSAYVAEWRDETPMSETVVFASDVGDRRVVAYLDWHTASGGSPSPATHVAIYQPKLGKIMQRWLAMDGKPMKQWEFAQFIERNLASIVSPAGADLLGIINEWSVEGSVRCSRVQRLENGTVNVSFSNEQTASARQMPVPTVFRLKMAIYERTDPVELVARLRYRLGGDGSLAFWFELDELEAAKDIAWDLILAQVRTGTGIAPLLGMPN